MQVRNISGSHQSFTLGGNHPVRASLTLDNNAYATVDNRPDIVASVFDYARQGLLEVSVPPPAWVLNERVPILRLVTLKTAATTKIVTVAGVPITMVGANVTLVAESLIAGVNQNETLRALGVHARDHYAISADKGVLIELPPPLVAGDVTSNDGTNAVVSTVQATQVVPEALLMSVRTVTSAGNTLVIPTGLRTILHLTVQVRRAGVLLALTGAITHASGVVSISNAGDTPLAASDVVTVVAYGNA